MTLVFAALDLGAAATGVGLTLGALSLAPILFLFVGGVVGDRLARDRVIVATHIARAGIQGAAAAVIMTGVGGLPALAALVFLYGAAEALYSPASAAILPSIVERSDLQSANASLAVVRRTIGVLGPGAAGLVIAAFGPAWVFVIDAVSFVAAGVLYSSIRTARAERLAERAGFRDLISDLREGWSAFASRRWLWVSVTIFSVSGVAMVPLFVLGPIVASDLELGEASWGVCVGIASIGSVVGSLAAGWLRFPRPLLIAMLLVLLLPLPMVALGVTDSIVLVAVSLAVAWVSAALANTLWATILQASLPQDKLARISSFDYWGSLALTPLAYAMVGPTSGVIGARETLLAASVLLAIVAFGGIALTPEIRRLRMGDSVDHHYAEGNS